MKTINRMYILVALVLSVVSTSARAEDVNRLVAAKTVMEHMCIYLQPDPKDLKEEDLFDVISDVLATRGVNNFQDTPFQDIFTVGEMEDIFKKVSAIAPGDQKMDVAVEVENIFQLGKNTPLSLDHLQIVVDNFPKCEPIVEAYTPPIQPPFLPTGPEVTPEEAASEI